MKLNDEPLILRRHQPLRDLLAFVLLALLGYLGNRMPLTLGFGMHYLFGTAFVLTGAMWRGPWFGLALGAIASLPTFALWGDGLAAVLMCVEALVIGLAARREAESYLAVDLLFWLLVGGPCMLAGGIYVVHYPESTAWIAALKMSVNGLFNVSLAGILALAADLLFETRHARMPLYRLIGRILSPVVLLPVLISTVATAQRYERMLHTEVRNEVLRNEQVVESLVGDWVRDRLDAVDYLARSVAPITGSPAEMTQVIQSVVEQHQGFLGAYVGDVRGQTLATYTQRFYPVAAGDDQSDRTYFQELVESGAGGVADVFLGLNGSEVVVPLVAPVRADSGDLEGYAVGALAPRHGQQLLERLDQASHSYAVITDRQDRVVLSTYPGVHTLDSYDGSLSPQARPLGDGVSLVAGDYSTPWTTANTAAVFAQGQIEDLGWKVYLIRPLADLQEAIYQAYEYDLVAGLLTMAAMLVALRLTLRGVTRSISLISNLRVAPDGRMLQVPDLGHARVKEVFQLQAHLAEVATRLSGALRQLAQQAEQDPMTGAFNAGAFRRDAERRLVAGEPFTLLMFDVDGFKRFNDLNGHLAGDHYLQGLARTVTQVLEPYEGQLYRYGGDEFTALLPVAPPEEERHLLARLAQVGGSLAIPEGKGSLFQPGVSVGISHCPQDGKVLDVLVRRADRALYGKKRQTRVGSRWFRRVVPLVTTRPDPVRLSQLEPLLTVLCQKVPGLYAHSLRVARLSTWIGREMGLTSSQCDGLELAALLHDLGKVEVPRAFLNSEGGLYGDQQQAFQQHPRWGGLLLIELVDDPVTAHVVTHHHERFDGQGFPDRLKRAEIPLEARIIGVADAFDGLIRLAPSQPEVRAAARTTIEEGAGSRFDPAVVQAFCAVLERSGTQ